ncbi:hypothetical protein M1307_00005, partial [Patescibacteria group bacterium]|nr:hypothetical protein [Patescibacteria group bacterium]
MDKIEREEGSHDILKRRMPQSLLQLADDIWTEHFGSVTIQKLPREEMYVSYHAKIYEIAFSIEHLARAGIIPKNRRLFDATGRMKPQLSKDELKRFLVDGKMLKGTKVCVVGGP